MTLPKIKPCPACGNIYVDLYSYENGWQHVECDECHYLGPGEGSQLQAIRSHNSASADRSPEGEKPQALNAKHESAVPTGQTPAPGISHSSTTPGSGEE